MISFHKDKIDLSIDTEQISENTLIIRHDIDRRHKDLLNKYPLKQYVRFLYSRPETASYTYIPPEIKRICNEIIMYGDRKVLQLYHKLVILSLIDNSKTRLYDINIPNSIKDLYLKWFEMIISEMDHTPEDFYEYPNDNFVKDLNLCALKLIPIGPAVIDLSVIPKRFLFKKMGAQFVRGVYFISFQVGGFKPLYQGHLYLRGLADFNPHEWESAYLKLADLLMIESQVKGYFGSSWYFDPEIQTISLHLAYKRQIIEHNGGRIFYIGSTPGDIKDATVKSPTRQRLYEEGKYIPTKYMFIWPRKQLINWAERYYNDNLKALALP